MKLTKKTKRLRQRMRQLVAETAGFYNLGNRALTDNNRCTYEDASGNRCAIGRCLSDNAIKLIHEKRLSNDSVDCLLGKVPMGRLRGIGIEFLAKLQRLHDVTNNWDGSGLSRSGREAASIVRTNIAKGAYDK